MIAVRVIVALAGLLVVQLTVGSAVRSVVLPRAVPVRLTRAVFGITRQGFRIRTGRAPTYERSDRIMALFGPTSMLVLLMTWLLLSWAGFAGAYWGLSPDLGVEHALRLSGSALFTLGFEQPGTILPTLLNFTEAAAGLVLLALLITYLPSMYNAFSKREAMVSKLEVRAGSPPSALTMIERFHGIGWLDQIHEQWSEWETWFIDVEESHTSFPALAFFRSPVPERSWVTAAGAVLDACAITISSFRMTAPPDASLCLRAGFLTLRRIADSFRLPYDPNPGALASISVAKEEFYEVYERLAALGIPLKPDREECWRDFKGWRVNYDECLLRLAMLTLAPVAPWSSDRSLLPTGRDHGPFRQWKRVKG